MQEAQALTTHEQDEGRCRESGIGGSKEDTSLVVTILQHNVIKIACQARVHHDDDDDDDHGRSIVDAATRRNKRLWTQTHAGSSGSSSGNNNNDYDGGLPRMPSIVC